MTFLKIVHREGKFAQNIAWSKVKLELHSVVQHDNITFKSVNVTFPLKTECHAGKKFDLMYIQATLRYRGNLRTIGQTVFDTSRLEVESM